MYIIYLIDKGIFLTYFIILSRKSDLSTYIIMNIISINFSCALRARLDSWDRNVKSKKKKIKNKRESAKNQNCNCEKFLKLYDSYYHKSTKYRKEENKRINRLYQMKFTITSHLNILHFWMSARRQSNRLWIVHNPDYASERGVKKERHCKRFLHLRIRRNAVKDFLARGYCVSRSIPSFKEDHDILCVVCCSRSCKFHNCTNPMIYFYFWKI